MVSFEFGLVSMYTSAISETIYLCGDIFKVVYIDITDCLTISNGVQYFINFIC